MVLLSFTKIYNRARRWNQLFLKGRSPFLNLKNYQWALRGRPNPPLSKLIVCPCPKPIHPRPLFRTPLWVFTLPLLALPLFSVSPLSRIVQCMAHDTPLMRRHGSHLASPFLRSPSTSQAHHARPVTYVPCFGGWRAREASVWVHPSPLPLSALPPSLAHDAQRNRSQR